MPNWLPVISATQGFNATVDGGDYLVDLAGLKVGASKYVNVGLSGSNPSGKD